jgi:5-methylcytosine-specific restriction protein A
VPSLAARACATPGCRNPARKARCTDCERKQQEARGTTTQRGYDADHNRLRIMAFQRDDWRCADCGWRPQLIVECETYGIDEPPLDVILGWLTTAYHRGERHLQGDHIQPIERRPDLRLDLDNYATLCSACHQEKTRRGGGVMHWLR